MKKKIAATMIMCSILQLAVPNMQAKAEPKKGNESETMAEAVDDALNNNLTIDEAENELSKKDKRDDDGDGLLNYWEESVNTNKDNPDTDGDGLTDYEEVVLTGTDPLKKDTNGDGIYDISEDMDGDGLTNRQEIELGTDPLALDTDGDGLTDWQETKDYKTNPNVFDTDADGADDGFEVAKRDAGVAGFDPLIYNEDMEKLLLQETSQDAAENVDQENVTKTDSDGDGIPDKEDTAPNERGLAGGIVGSLQIVGSHNTDEMFTEGHSFLVYTSYVDGQEVTIDDLYGSYDFNKKEYGKKVAKNEQLLSWRSLVDECTVENDAQRKQAADSMWPVQKNSVTSYNLNRGEYLTIGNFTQNSYMESLKDGLMYGQSGTMMEMVALQALYEAATGEKVDVMFIMSHLEEVTKLLAQKSYIKKEDVIDGTTDGGIWINREMYDQRYQYDQYPHEIYQVDVTQAELDKMIRTLNDNNYYSILNHNCSSVSTLAWNAAVGYKTDENGNYLTDEKGSRIESDLNISARGKGALSIMDFPGAVCEGILALKEKGTERGSYYSDYSHIVQGNII